MTLAQAKSLVELGYPMGAVLGKVPEADRDELKRWFVCDLERDKDHPCVPPADKPVRSAVEVSREIGYTGDACGKCGSLSVRRNGSCLLCDSCGETSGCS